MVLAAQGEVLTGEAGTTVAAAALIDPRMPASPAASQCKLEVPAGGFASLVPSSGRSSLLSSLIQVYRVDHFGPYRNLPYWLDI